jgi:hypothetical protein
MTELRKKPGTMCAEVVIDGVVAGEVEFKNFEPVDRGGGPAWRWRDNHNNWGDAIDQDDAVRIVTERWNAT